MTEKPKNLAASIRARLKNISQQTGDDFQFVLIRYAAERFLYRLSVSPYSGKFILKGATLFRVWGRGEAHRATRDLDLLGFGDNSDAAMDQVFRNILGYKVDDDGLVFDPATIQVAAKREEEEYPGVSVVLTPKLENIPIKVKIDVGFGDAVHPTPVEQTMSPLLDLPAPTLRIYPREAVVAEKFQAMVKIGVVTTRFKDFYDIWVLARDYEFEGPVLHAAITATFERRQTDLPATPPPVLQTAFWETSESGKLWKGFLEKAELDHVTASFAEVAASVAEFVMPVSQAAAASVDFSQSWNPGGPWK